ncbi:MAG: TonB-dependent receptor [Sphingorhabdus sp.]|nr:TonB-dependent receptor [Sphingorhabdus sp.]
MAATFMTPVYAQEKTEPVADSGEILVTALRRDANLQDVPAAVTAFTAEAIENAGIERPSEFINLTSNVNLVETQNSGNAFIIIRGITQARNSEPSVAVVIDGVQQVNPASFNQELVDVGQIEVLKGPQGGLYGRNAIGGAIIINSQKPTDEFSGKISAGIDNGFGWQTRASISGPLGEGVKFRVAGSYRDTDGYIRNTFLNEDADPVKDLSIRGNLLFDIGENLTVDLRASYARLETQALYFNIVNDVNDTSLPVRVNNRGQNDRDIVNVAAKVEYNADAFTVTSITSYDTVSEVLTGDAFNFLPIEESLLFGLFGIDINQSQFLSVKAFSQELRFASPADQPLFWMFGGYYIATDRFISTGNQIDLGNGVLPLRRSPSTNPLNPQQTFLADEQDNAAWALFANLGYEFSDQLRVDGSLRYDRDRRTNTTLTPTAFLPNVSGAPQGVTGERRRITFDDLQPKFTVTYQPSEDVTLYGGYSRGFRSGGFNQTGVGAVAASNGIVGVNDIFDAETATTFEAGIKTRLLDRKLTLNAAAYSTISKNSYFFVFLAANSTQNLGNIPKTQLQGFELEANLRPAPTVQLNAAVGYTWSEIKEFPVAAVVGNEAPLISRYTLNLGAQFTPAITDDVSGLLRVDYRRIGRTWWEPFNTTSRNPVDLVDARLGVSGDAWALTAFSENLFNKEYNAEFSPGGFVFKARPRRYGVEASYKF